MIVVFFAVQSASACEKIVSELNWFERVFKTLTWKEVVQTVDNPKEICSVVRHHVRYQRDNGDEWATGKETWEREYGDCEDIAAAVAELCEKKNISAKIFMLYPEGEDEGHVVVIGQWRGRLWLSSNGWFEYARSESDIVSKVTREMRWKQKNVVAMDWDTFRAIDSNVRPAAGQMMVMLPIISQQ